METDIYYFPPDQTIEIPSLLSNYKFIAIKNGLKLKYKRGNNTLGPEFSSSGGLSEKLFTKFSDYKTGQLIGTFFEAKDKSVWLVAVIMESPNLNRQTTTEESSDTDQTELKSETIFAHASSQTEIESMLSEIGRFDKFSYEDLPNNDFILDIERVRKPANYTFKDSLSNNRYSIYMPPGYKYTEKKFEYSSVYSWKKDNGTSICIDQLNQSKDECRSPGGPCTNYWGTFADLVISPSRSLKFEISNISVCGDKEPVFVVKNFSNEWAQGSNFTADRPEDYPEIINMFYMLDSVRKIPSN